MKRELVDDGLWELIAPLLPERRRRKRFPGRKPLDDRSVLNGIVFVLQTGMAWELLPQEMGYGSGMTCWRRLRRWQKAGVWKRVHEVLLAELRHTGQLDMSRAIADSSSIRAVHGGKKQVRTPRIAAKQAASTTSSSMRKGSH